MAVYDRKLGDWFKEVEKLAEQLRAKKQQASTPAQPKETSTERQNERLFTRPTQSAVPSFSSQVPERETQVASAGQTSTVNENSTISVAEKPGPSAGVSLRPQDGAALFDESEIPQVEDFISFLDGADGVQKSESIGETKSSSLLTVESEQPLLNLSEGTGVPRPIVLPQQPSVQSTKVETQKVSVESRKLEATTRVEPEKASSVVSKEEKPKAKSEASTDYSRESSVEEKWARVPAHLRALFEGEVEEVAQRSYKTFKESRASLIERLLDPTITLEDTARLLNVCPTTVRRYTNKGILKHFRTPGNQRRFKLSDVIAFLESRKSEQLKGKKGEREET